MSQCTIPSKGSIVQTRLGRAGQDLYSEVNITNRVDAGREIGVLNMIYEYSFLKEDTDYRGWCGRREYMRYFRAVNIDSWRHFGTRVWGVWSRWIVWD